MSAAIRSKPSSVRVRGLFSRNTNFSKGMYCSVTAFVFCFAKMIFAFALQDDSFFIHSLTLPFVTAKTVPFGYVFPVGWSSFIMNSPSGVLSMPAPLPMMDIIILTEAGLVYVIRRGFGIPCFYSAKILLIFFLGIKKAQCSFASRPVLSV